MLNTEYTSNEQIKAKYVRKQKQKAEMKNETERRRGKKRKIIRKHNSRSDG